MRKLGRSTSDSLELLLDTVCSMFGAIMLIAILVALLAQTGKVDSSAERSTAEMLERKIVAASADLALAQRLRDQLSQPADVNTAALAAEKRRMEQAVVALREKERSTDKQVGEQVSRQSADFSVEWKKLGAELAALERQQTEAANTIKAQDQNSERLRMRAAEMVKLTQTEKDARVAKLRFPKERARLKKSFAIIFKYGRVYPLHDESSIRNRRTIEWKTHDDADESIPIRDKGWTKEDRVEIEGFLRKLPKGDFYLGFYVYPDSYEIFRATRDAAVAMGLEFGLEIIKGGSGMYWGTRGTTPPPL